MTYRRVIQNYYSDIGNLSDLLTKLVGVYGTLIGGADTLNKIALSSKGDIKKALKRANELGNIIDGLINSLENSTKNYSQYSNIKSKIVKEYMDEKTVLKEIEEELKFKD